MKFVPPHVNDTKEKRQEYEKNLKRFAKALKTVYKTEDGKFVIDGIIELSGLYLSPMENESLECFLGRRHVGAVIYRNLTEEVEDE